MSDLIRREALIEKLKKSIEWCEGNLSVDAVEVVHGYWIAKMIPTGVSAFGVDELTCEEEECSVCHKLYWVGEEKNYCPNCGAKMDGRTE